MIWSVSCWNIETQAFWQENDNNSSLMILSFKKIGATSRMYPDVSPPLATSLHITSLVSQLMITFFCVTAISGIFDWLMQYEECRDCHGCYKNILQMFHWSNRQSLLKQIFFWTCLLSCGFSFLSFDGGYLFCALRLLVE